MSYSPRFRQKSEQLMQRESRTSGKLFLPVCRGPSHREMTSERNNEAPSRISNRTSPWWFIWQTVALLLLLDTDPYHAITPLIQVALSQFSEGDQTNNISQELSEASQAGSMLEPVHNKVRLEKDNHLQCTGSIRQTMSFFLRRSIESCPTTCLAFLEDIIFSLRGNSVLMVKNSLHFIFNISREKLHINQFHGVFWCGVAVHYCSCQGNCPGSAYKVGEWSCDQALLTPWCWHLHKLPSPWISFHDLSYLSTTNPITSNKMMQRRGSLHMQQLLTST